MTKSENTNTIFPILKDEPNYHMWYICLVPSYDLNIHVLHTCTSSDIFVLNNMIPNSIFLFTYPSTPLHLVAMMSKPFVCCHVLMDVHRVQHFNHKSCVSKPSSPTYKFLSPLCCTKIHSRPCFIFLGESLIKYEGIFRSFFNKILGIPCLFYL